MLTTFVPNDYEACSQCGFDHSYEANEAARMHIKLFRDCIVSGLYHDPIESDATMIAACDLALKGDSFAYELVVLGIAAKEGY